jgi:5'-3' exonuclease
LGANWKKGLSAEYARRKHLKRREKKQLAARLQQLHADFAAQACDLHSMQQLEADALRARLSLRLLHAHVGLADASSASDLTVMSQQ